MVMRSVGWAGWRRVRQGVQILFLAFFVYQLFTIPEQQGGLPTSFFFRFNPLSALAAMSAAHAWLPDFGWALVVVGLTFLAGRVWCGWICPLGTLLEWASFRPAIQKARKIAPRWRIVKYILLVVLLVAAVCGNLTLMILEPLALFTRTMTVVVIPGLNYVINAGEAVLYPFDFLRPLIDTLEGLLRGTILPAKQPVFFSPLPTALLFAGVLALNFLTDRFWCRYLCPLGALLGWMAKFSLFRPIVGSACTGCTRCALTCKPGAIRTASPAAAVRSAADITILPSECTVCLDCLHNCAKDSMRFMPAQPTFRAATPAQEFDLSRREFLQAALLGLAGVALLRIDTRQRVRSSWLIRPPGVMDETEFLAKCVRCGECLRVCPTTALQPASSQAGVEGGWTPVLAPRVGYCDYGCNICGQVCPSQAIPRLTLAEKRQQVLGKASVNRNRCLPWASNTPCIVCEEMCPTPQKAIRLENVTVTDESGALIELQRPYVLRHLCIGCGICENHCPLDGEAAIRVYGVIS